MALRLPVTRRPVLGGTEPPVTRANKVTICPCSMVDGDAEPVTFGLLFVRHVLAAFCGCAAAFTSKSAALLSVSACPSTPPGLRSMPRLALVPSTVSRVPSPYAPPGAPTWSAIDPSARTTATPPSSANPIV